MWELIHSNQRKTLFLVSAMALVLVALGFAIGEAFAPGGGLVGLAIALGVWTVMSLVSYFQGDNILLAVSGAAKIERDDHPQLFNVVEEMAIASGKGKIPDIYVMNDSALNAFATGRDPEHAAVAVTSGLLSTLNRDELQGVIAHEMSHIKNRDVLLMTMLGVMLGAIVFTAEMYLRSLRHAGRGSRRYGGGKGGGQAQIVMMVVAVIFALLAPFLAQLIYFAVSRRREYLADAGAAVMTRYPEGLASALERISGGNPLPEKVSKATAPMFIADPYGPRALSGLTSTHPPIGERIKILRTMGNAVSYTTYQQAWCTTKQTRRVPMPQSALTDDAAVAAREPNPGATPNRQREVRYAGDLVRKAAGFAFIPCACGVRVKLPPGFRGPTVECPRCQNALSVPGTFAESGPASDGEISVRLQGDGWRTFRCECGTPKTVSPSFSATSTACSACGRTIRILPMQ